MVIKSYSVTLEEEIVKKVRKKLRTGQKLSPVINELLEQWLEKNQ